MVYSKSEKKNDNHFHTLFSSHTIQRDSSASTRVHSCRTQHIILQNNHYRPILANPLFQTTTQCANTTAKGKHRKHRRRMSMETKPERLKGSSQQLL